jgi:photosystem II stability/assembly factor-like uncharacterized protein
LIKMKTKTRNLLFAILGLVLLLVVFSLARKEKAGIETPGMDRPDGFIEYYKQITTPIGQENSGYMPNYAYKEYLKALKKSPRRLKNADAYTWEQRGPGNVGGRTRTVIIDPDDASGNTWFAGSASGGIWKTTNSGQTWQNLTVNIPNLSTAALAMAESNTSVIYAGTGEGYGGEGMVSGNGIFISTNKGNSWEHISSTQDNERFRFINKIWVDPSDDSSLVVATNEGLFKSLDAGQSWLDVYTIGYAVQDIVQNPQNENVIYAGVNGLGVIKSYDKGSTWTNSYNGLGECYRVSLSVSPVDTSIIYAGVEAPSYQTHIYRSTDAGKTWSLNYNADGLFMQFHGQQGWFNNVVAAHPFDKDKVYIGGVYFGMLEFDRFTYNGYPEVLRVDTVGTGSYMNFVGFGGSKFRGALATGLDEGAEVEKDDFVTVELRFGNGISQKAHRFYVPEGEGAGVPPEDYMYQDYVDVPFQAWDLDNNRQLMVSFRDQNRNGKFDLIEREYNEDIDGREYVFISAYNYNATSPDGNIAVDGGYEQKLLYFLWPYLIDDGIWDPDNLADSKVTILYGTMSYQNAYTKVLADDRLNENLHVDHHDIKFHVVNSSTQQFNIIEANDGGLGFSADEGATWEQIDNGYVTTQFYGVAKRPDRHEYIGGMQDNGTWQSPVNVSATSTSEYDFRIEGDGFEALWHPWYPQRILGSSYNNYIKISNDFGETWEWTIDGINGDGPFITKLSHSRENPNLVFAVGGKGLYKHINFGMGHHDWQLIDLEDYWSVQNTVTSSHHVKVSLANPEVVWAGGAMYKEPDLNLFLSKDYGETFDTVSTFTDVELGYISGLATHPVNPAEAFVLFSLRAKPKIIRTMDYGQTWNEISGFGQDSTSSNGFPDVLINDLLVLPTDTNTIWAATEIGLFESTDNGISWHYADNGLPPVSIWQLDIIDNVIIAATHGRGIWTTSLSGTVGNEEISKTDVARLYPNPASKFVGIKLISDFIGQVDVNIYNIEGKQIVSNKLNKIQHYHESEFDIQALSAGNYILVIQYMDRQITRKLIVK